MDNCWVFGMNWWRQTGKALFASLITVVLVLSLVGCGDRLPGGGRALSAATQTVSRSLRPSQPSGDISEVSPPEVIQVLSQALEGYQPQVAILSPQPDELLQDNTVSVRFQVQDLPIFKNQELDLGPHLQVILDNQPYIAVYDLNQPLVLSDLTPGTHTVRVFASRPWDESFKNEGAYAQTTFHIFTKTQDNNPDPAQPLLTYSRPEGAYGAEPILLDFYLTNAPLHLVAQEEPEDDIADWRIRCTINGNSFVLDRWQPLYLKGFKPGKNWVQLEFLDEQGNTVKNVFNNTVRLITYEPKGKDTLSKLMRGQLSAAEARSIVSRSLSEPAAPTPTLTPAPAIEKEPETKLGEDKQANPDLESKEPTETKQTAPKQSQQQKPRGFFNQLESTPEPKPLVTPRIETYTEVEPAPSTSEPQPKESKQKGGFFNRFQSPAAKPSPSLPPTLPEIIEAPSPEPIAPDVKAPQPEPQPLVRPRVETSPEVEPTPSDAVPSPSLPPTLPEIIEAPSPEAVGAKAAP